MIRTLLASIFFILLLASGVHADEPARGPLFLTRGPILLDYETLPLLEVTFNHSSHKKISCVKCHHMPTSDGDRYASCTTDGCHSIPGARERTPDSMFMAYHALDSDHSCYGCHTREADHHPSFIGCRPCHYKPLQASK